MHSTKRPPSVTGVRLTRLAQAVALLAAVKLAAIGLLWFPPAPPENELLQPVVIRVAAAGQALAAEAAPAAPDASKAEAPEKHGGNATAATTNSFGSAKTEADQVQDLNARQLALDKKEAELKALEMELDEKLEKLKAMEVRMQALIDSAGSIQAEKMQHLVDVYSNMKPKQAAQVLETLEETIAVRILAGMSGRKAGEILSSVRPDQAARLSEALTRLQTGENGKAGN
jgi:flagellar motility protein MotE (MotC chaperone)